MKKLWLMLVEHSDTPGTVPVLFYQAATPSERATKKRAGGVSVPHKKLRVTGEFDLSWACAADAANLKAIQAFDDADTRAAMKGAQS